MISASALLIQKYGRCPVKGCQQAATEEQQILYNWHQRGPVTKRPCSDHHGWITRRQAHARRKQRSDLSEKQRWFFWYELIEGRMKRPRATSLDIEWSKQRPKDRRS